VTLNAFVVAVDARAAVFDVATPATDRGAAAIWCALEAAAAVRVISSSAGSTATDGSLLDRNAMSGSCSPSALQRADASTYPTAAASEAVVAVAAGAVKAAGAEEAGRAAFAAVNGERMEDAMINDPKRPALGSLQRRSTGSVQSVNVPKRRVAIAASQAPNTVAIRKEKA
jgi:hypothetical protein